MIKKCLAMSCLITLVACSKSSSSWNEPSVQNLARFKYEQEQYPKMFDKYGTDTMDMVNRFMPAAVKYAAEHKDCDKPEVVEFSAIKSTKENIQYFADCSNGNRIIIFKYELL